jgi:hypothetical protein
LLSLGLSLAFLSAKKIVLTDLSDVVSLLTHNIQLNQFLQTNAFIQPILKERTFAREYFWGSPLEENNILFQEFQESSLLIASDVIYDPMGYQPLLDSLEWWLSLPLAAKTRKRKCILAHRHRHPEDGKFFSLISQSTIIEMNEIPRDTNDLSSSSSSSQSSLQDVLLFEIIRREDL